MPTPSLEFVLGSGLVVAAIIVIAMGPRSTGLIALAAGVAILASLLVVAVPLEPVEAALRAAHLVRPIEVALGVLGLVALRLVPDRRLGTAMATAGGLLALHAVGLCGGWAL